MIVFQSCDTTQKDWENATIENSLNGYEEFLDKHPQNEFTNTALERIAYFKLKSTESDLSINRIQEFLVNYPNSKYTEKCISMIDSISFTEALISSKIDHSRFDNLNSSNLSSKFKEIEKGDKQELLKVLVKKHEIYTDSSHFISSINLAKGKDWNKFVESIGMNMRGGTTTQKLRTGEEYKISLEGLALDESRIISNGLFIGTGSYISDLTYSKLNLEGSFTIMEQGENIIHKTFYPNDKLYFAGKGLVSIGDVQVPFGKNTIVRVLGESANFFEGITIKSSSTEPLHFLLEEDGLYFLIGKGEIEVKGGKKFTFN